MKKLNFILPHGTYPFDVMVSIGETEAEVKKRLLRYYEKHKVDEIEIDKSNTCQGRAIMLESNQSILWLRKYPKSHIDYGYLQHEIFHLVEMLFERIGIKLCRKSAEAFAYQVQFLTENIYKKLNR